MVVVYFSAGWNTCTCILKAGHAQEPIYMAFWKKLGVDENVPSSGFMGVMIAQHCSSQDAVISLYGFNWSPENWDAHNVSSSHTFDYQQLIHARCPSPINQQQAMQRYTQKA